MQRLLTDKQALEIRTLHHEQSYSVAKLRKQFLPETDVKTGYKIIRQILCGATYVKAGGKIGINPFVPKEKIKTSRKVKLTPAQKLEIIEWHDDDMSQGDIMRRLAHRGINVSRAYISRIISGER